MIQVVVGLAFSAVWFLVFRFLIKKFNFLTPGREEDGEDAKLYTKKDYRAKQAGGNDLDYAAQILAYLGGKDNIIDVTNCATRLRVNVKDGSLVRPEAEFKRIGAHGLSKNGTAIQVIVGLKVPKVREQFEECLAKNILPQEAGPALEAAGDTASKLKAEGAHNEKSDTKRKGEAESLDNAQALNTGCLYAAQTGEAVPLENVPDDVFSQKVMGDGIAVIPKDKLVVSPAAGEVVVVAETKHAYALVTEDGAEVLIHIGLETVNLQGKGFKALVKPGDKVQIGTPLCEVEDALLNGQTPLYTPMIITNADELKELKIHTGSVAAGKDCIIEYVL